MKDEFYFMNTFNLKNVHKLKCPPSQYYRVQKTDSPNSSAAGRSPVSTTGETGTPKIPDPKCRMLASNCAVCYTHLTSSNIEQIRYAMTRSGKDSRQINKYSSA